MEQAGYDKMVFAKNLTLFMERSGERQVDIAKILGVSKATVSGYCRGMQMPRMDKVELLAKHFGVAKSILLEQPTIADKEIQALLPVPQRYQVPRLGRITSGVPIFSAQNVEGQDQVPEQIHADFSIVCRGNGMINARIFDGDIVFICRTTQVENGDVAVVLIDGELTLKRIYRYPNRVELRPENPTFPVLNFEGEEMKKLIVLGKAVAFVGRVL